MAPQPPAIGDRIGPYVLEERVGRGGFGEVWRARHSVLEEKVVAAKIPTEDAYIGVLRREGIIQHRLKHPLIVEMLDIDIDHDPPYLVMEYVEGEDLRKRLTREAPLALEATLRISEEILEALQVAHGAGAIHRDLKPGNVLLPREGGIKLTDFGLGTAIDASRPMLLRSQTMRSEEIGSVAGTLAYMAPEQRSGKGPVDGRADIFAFGVILFEMITGELPVGPVAPSQLRDDLWPEYDELYRKCCAPNPHRYESVSQVLRALRSLPAPEPEPIVVAPTPEEEKADPLAEVEAEVVAAMDESDAPAATGKLPAPTRSSRFSAAGFLLFSVAIVVGSVGLSKMGDGTSTGPWVLILGFVLGVLGLVFLVRSGFARDEAGTEEGEETSPADETPHEIWTREAESKNLEEHRSGRLYAGLSLTGALACLALGGFNQTIFLMVAGAIWALGSLLSLISGTIERHEARRQGESGWGDRHPSSRAPRDGRKPPPERVPR